jgi:DNA repair protein RecN (Recombination protein N)
VLTSLVLRDVVLIEALTLEFGDGLGVLTGETGAGKSILLDGLGLALGARADSGLVRQGAAQAQVTAEFALPPGHPARTLLADADIEVDDDALIVRRSVKADGGSRAHVNDAPVSGSLLRELGATLVEVHGQHDERGLLNPRGHRALLDAFGHVATAPVAAAHAAWLAADRALTEARDTLEAALRDRDWLLHAVEELTKLSPQPGEEVELAEARATMMKGAKLADDLAAITAPFEGSDGAAAQLRTAAKRLDRVAAEHPLLTDALAALDRAILEADEAETKLAAAGQALSFEPSALDAAEARLFELRAMARKHRVDVDALPAHAAALAARAEAIDAGEARVAALAKALATAHTAYTAAAATLSAARTAAATRLDAAVKAELAPLKLEAARFRTVVATDPEAAPTAHGRDRVEFEISTNPGAPFAPLAKIASGGELSRFILALKVALAESGAATTMIFDEIDRGVGGAVASAIGERLARLASSAQVLVVTHSPQVAARGSAHWLIAKRQNDASAVTTVTPLSDEDRREEIARMLSGAHVTEEARAQATRLLA